MKKRAPAIQSKTISRADSTSAGDWVLIKAPFWACLPHKDMLLCTDNERLYVLSGMCGQIVTFIQDHPKTKVSDLLSGFPEKERPYSLRCLKQIQSLGIIEAIETFGE
jgi:hypothetical protein